MDNQNHMITRRALLERIGAMGLMADPDSISFLPMLGQAQRSLGPHLLHCYGEIPSI